MSPLPVARWVLAAGLCAVVVGALTLPSPGTPQLGTIPAATAPDRATTVLPAAIEPARARVHVSPPADPRRLRLVRLGADAGVVPVSLHTEGSLEVPDNPSVIGWWNRSARPGGGIGTVVLDGHVDSARYGIGIFAGLRALRLGDRIDLGLSDGRHLRYAVAARRYFVKAQLPRSLFDQRVSERLVLITCGGRFDRRTAHYSDNVVVFAVPEVDAS